MDYEPNNGGMPSAQLAEEAILCCMMRYPQGFIAKAAAESIDGDCFWVHREAFEAIQRFHKKFPECEEIDLHLFVQELELDHSLQRCGGPSTIADLVMRGPVELSWDHYAGQLKEAKARRIALSVSKALGDAETSESAVECARNAVEALTAALNGKMKAIQSREAGKDFLKRFEEAHRNGDIPGKSTGYTEVDSISGGMRPGELWVIGAQSSRGKSVMMLQIAAEFLGRGETVAVFSLELMAHEVTGRLACVLGRANYGAITQPRTATSGDLKSIKRGVEAFVNSRAWIEDSAGQTLEWIETEAQRIRDTSGSLDLIVVDYLQIISGGRQRNESREQEIARSSAGLKQLAKRLGCPVITGSQLNEQGQTRESRAIVHDSDALLFITHEGVKIGKMRNGKRDSLLNLHLDGNRQIFTQSYSTHP